MLLDLRSQRAELLPFRHVRDGLVAVLAHAPDLPVVGGLMHLQRDETRGSPFGIDGTAHRGPPFRISAMWMTFIGNFRRSITPFICIRQDMSAEAMYSTPWRWKSGTRW